MTAEATTTAPPAPAAPAAAGPGQPDPAEENAPAEDCRICRIMPGLLILGVAVVLGAIGIDLASNGALSRRFGGGGEGEADGDDST